MGFLAFDTEGIPEQTFLQQKDDREQIHRKVEDVEGLKHRIDNLRTSYDLGEEFGDWPIYGRDAVLGVFV